MSDLRLARVFPTQTRACPRDPLAFFGAPDMFVDVDEVHISTTFTYAKSAAERLFEEWDQRFPGRVKIGGVAYDGPGNEFVPGRYVRPGYTFTSRGCPRRCWFCKVWHTHPEPILFPITDGWNILDDNLLACPRPHVEAVFAMLQRVSREQRQRVEFTGGLEAAALEDYQVGLLADLRPRPTCFWAYDPGDPFETLKSAADRLLAAGFTARSHDLRCYVLIGFPGDDFVQAEDRLCDMLRIGFTPMAMLWRPDDKPAQQRHEPEPEWRSFQRRWARPAIIHAVYPKRKATRFSLPILEK